MSIDDLLEGYDRNGTLGRLTGISAEERDRLIRRLHDRLSGELERARAAAAESGAEVEVDCSPLAGVNGGERWLVRPDRSATRELDRFPEVEGLIRTWPGSVDALGSEPGEGGGTELGALRPLLLRCAYNGLWSPSGTNWQPMRAVELASDDLGRLARAAKASLPVDAPGLAILARSDYESLLGDVAAIASYQPRSHAEHIDAGIYRSACELTAAAHGAATRVAAIPDDSREALGAALGELLAEHLSSSDLRGQDRARPLLQMLAGGEYLLDALFCPPPAADPCPLPAASAAELGGLPLSRFDELVAVRCSQRLASTCRDLPPEDFVELWSAARAGLPVKLQEQILVAPFRRRSEPLRQIGSEVFRGMYGEGADPNSGEGGSGGLLSRLTVDGALEFFRKEAGGELPPELAMVAGVDDAGRPDAAELAAVPLDLIPRRLRQFILSKPHFSPGDGCVLDRMGVPMSLGHLLRLVRVLTVTFGHLYLAFEDTHPVTAVICARRAEDPASRRAVFTAVGELLARLSWLCRARGLVSVIKSGPTEISHEGIERVVAGSAGDDVRRRLEGGGWEAAIVFQAGHALGPDDVVEVRGADRNGLELQPLDRRAPRNPLSEHYFPRPEA